MPYRLVDSSSDIVVEADGPDAGAVLVELARAFTHVTTAGSTLVGHESRPFRLTARGLPRLAVAFVNELVFLFATDGFLATGGRIEVSAPRPSEAFADGTLTGTRFDSAQHALGTEVKAATLHDAVFDVGAGGARARLLLDL